MSVLIVLPAMAQSAGLFRRAIQAARERSDTARAVCVIHPSPGAMLSGGAHALGKLADALAAQERERAGMALDSLAQRAGRVGLELDATTQTGDLPEVVLDCVHSSRIGHVILIRPRSELLGSAIDTAVAALQDNYDGEVVVIE